MTMSEETDLIYEGIETYLFRFIFSLLSREETDLIYEGIETSETLQRFYS